MNRINYIFVDFESVHETDWERIANKPVKVTLVLGEQHKFFPIAVVKKLLKCASQVELVETKRTGKNAADFVLAELSGGQNKSDPQGYFHVVSKDKGFDALIEHLKTNGILAARRASFSDIPILMNTAERVKSLTSFFKDHPQNRPAKKKPLETQIQALFGKAFTAEEIAETVTGLVTARVVEISSTGAVSYPTTSAT